MTWHADLPEDFVELVEILQQDTLLNAKEEY
jgi:23S rRNA pseudouridine1911/1915/1917 synthase